MGKNIHSYFPYFLIALQITCSNLDWIIEDFDYPLKFV